MPRKPRPWFRFYVEAVHDRKLRRLKPEHRWLFVACLAAARSSCAPGWLLVGRDDPMGWDDLADFAGMPVGSVRAGVAALCGAGVLGWDEPSDAWFIPAWDSRQYESDTSTTRTQKYRGKERSNDVPGTAEGTAPETETDTDPSLVPSLPDLNPHPVGKLDADVIEIGKRQIAALRVTSKEGA